MNRWPTFPFPDLTLLENMKWYWGKALFGFMLDPTLCGQYILRCTTDPNYSDSSLETFLEIKPNSQIKLSTTNYQGVLETSCIRRGSLVPNYYTNNSVIINFTSRYSYIKSIAGIEIPKSINNKVVYEKPRYLTIQSSYNHTLLTYDQFDRDLFYVWDIYRKDRSYIETRWNHFLILQLLNLILNIITMHLL